MKFSGSYVPLVTPFDSKKRLDTSCLERLLSWHIEQGTDGIVCNATTGEGTCLTDREKKKIAQICIQTCSSKIPVIVSTGTADTKATVRNTEIALKLGASGALVITPYYNKPSERGCIFHYKEVAKVGLPIILYHNPARTALRLSAETILELSRVPNIVAIKESSFNLDLVRKIQKEIAVFSGDDSLTFEIMKEGGVGSIATSANLVPKGWKQMISSCLKGAWEDAEKLKKRYTTLGNAIFLETNPQGVKFALSKLGKCKDSLRLPLLVPTEPTKKSILEELLFLALPFSKRNLKSINFLLA